MVDLDVKSKLKSTKSKVKRNLLYTLTDLESVPQSEKQGFQVNGLFGNPDYESICQVTLTTNSAKTKTLLRNLPAKLPAHFPPKLRQHLIE